MRHPSERIVILRLRIIFLRFEFFRIVFEEIMFQRLGYSKQQIGVYGFLFENIIHIGSLAINFSCEPCWGTFLPA